MKQLRQLAILCLLMLMATFSFAQRKAFQDGRMWVKVKPELRLTLPTMKNAKEINNLADYPELMSLMQKYDATLFKKAFVLPELRDFYEIGYNAFEKADELVRDMQALSYIEYAEKMPMAYPDYTPNDYNSAQQWHLAKIEATLAWDISIGSNKIKIAVVDDAVKRDHEDLATQIWANPGEIANDGIDNDMNGFIDDKYGFDIADNDPETTPLASIVDCGDSTGGYCHGTTVSSCAASATNNGKGVAGIGFNCKIIPIKCRADNNTIGGITHGYQGIEYAALMGADVINCSWGGTGNSPTGQSVITAAHNRGCIIVASAGNDDNAVAHYPSGYKYVIAVAASDANDHKAGFSCYHDSVDVTAPGVSIKMAAATTTSSYIVGQGTSMSSPITAGLCGLMLSANPCLTPEEVEYHLQASCDVFSDMNLPQYQGKLGAGRINAKKALQAVNPTVAPTAAFTSTINACGGIVDYSYTGANTAACANVFKWFITGGTPPYATTKDLTVTYPTSGAYNVRLIVSNGVGIDTLDQIVNVTVAPYPDLTLAANSMVGCAGDSVQFSATCTTGVTYAWSPNVGLSSSTILSPKAKCTLPRTYYLTATNAAGCTDTDTLFLDVKPKPANVTANDVTGAPNTDIQLTATCGTAGVSYSWVPATSLSSTTIANPICNTPSNRMYQVTVANQYNCTKNDYALVDVGVTGIDFPNGNIAAISPIYPNPAQEVFSLKAQFTGNVKANIRMFDALGKYISTLFEGNIPAGDFNQNFQRNNLSTGIYTIAWEIDGQVFTQKVSFE